MGDNQADHVLELLKFINNSATSFHAVHQIGELLAGNNFSELPEREAWKMEPGGSYFIKRNSSSIVIFTLGEEGPQSGFRMAGAHTDSPCLKIKPNPARISHSYLQLGVEPYGGGLLTTWFDRDLSIAGRVTWNDAGAGIHAGLIDFRKPVAIIPSLAIHLDREANEKKTVNKQNDLFPILMQTGEDKVDFHALLQKQLTEQYPTVTSPRILDHELFLYDSQPPSLVGLKNEFICGARLDNLLSCHTLVRSLIDSDTKQNTLIILNDHEEAGSLSTSGAQGNFLQSVLERIVPEHETRQRSLSRSIFISADNAHGVHPNYADRYDKEHLPLLNKGPVIKFNANQRYATNSQTATFFRMLCEKAEIPVQEFVMRSDLACGSTIGPITAGQIGVRTVDVGIPSLAMHSIRETVGALDVCHFHAVLRMFFATPPDDEIWRFLSI